MFIDLFNDLFLNSTAFYLYFGIILMTIGISQFSYLSGRMFANSSSLTMGECYYVKFHIHRLHSPLYIDTDFITWFIITFKRIDIPDDDKEHPSDSYFNHGLKIRGGQIWGQTMYSPNLKAFTI